MTMVTFQGWNEIISVQKISVAKIVCLSHFGYLVLLRDNKLLQESNYEIYVMCN